MIHPDTYPALGGDDVYVVTTLDGSDTLFSNFYGTTYHSLTGAVGESRHIFIQHGFQRLSNLPSIRILEIGFGTGLNAFLAFLYSKKLNRSVTYMGIEAFPIAISIARQLNYPAYLAAEKYKDTFLKMHLEKDFSIDQFQFRTLYEWKFDANQSFDCVFFDAFAPDNQPELWEQHVFELLYSLMANNGFLVTYCARGEVRRRMERAGFEVSRIPGAPGKREMLQARKRSN